MAVLRIRVTGVKVYVLINFAGPSRALHELMPLPLPHLSPLTSCLYILCTPHL